MELGLAIIFASALIFGIAVYLYVRFTDRKGDNL